MSSMAVPAPSPQNESSANGFPTPLESRPVIVRHVAKLYGQGLTRLQIARAMAHHLCPDSQEPYRRARNLLRSWEQKQWFRDMVWEQAVVKLDMTTPQILVGVSAKAKKGRVDAAKLLLEITGRHVTKGEASAPNITIHVGNVPRPEGSPTFDVDGEADEVD